MVQFGTAVAELRVMDIQPDIDMAMKCDGVQPTDKRVSAG
jgi:hypothetical protein